MVRKPRTDSAQAVAKDAQAKVKEGADKLTEEGLQLTNRLLGELKKLQSYVENLLPQWKELIARILEDYWQMVVENAEDSGIKLTAEDKPHYVETAEKIQPSINHIKESLLPPIRITEFLRSMNKEARAEFRRLSSEVYDDIRRNLRKHESAVINSEMIIFASNKLGRVLEQTGGAFASELMTPWKKRANYISAAAGLAGSAAPMGYLAAQNQASKGNKATARGAYIATILGEAITDIGSQVAQLVAEREDLEAEYTKDYARVSVDLAQTFGNIEAVPGLESTIREGNRRAGGRMKLFDLVQEVLDEDETESVADTVQEDEEAD